MHKCQNPKIGFPGKLEINFHVNWNSFPKSAQKVNYYVVRFLFRGEFSETELRY